MKRLLLGILGVIIVLLQNTIINYLSVFGITINLVLIYLVIISLYLDEVESGIIGIILGFILDCSVGGIFGLNALLLSFLCYFISHEKEKVYKESPIMIFTIILGVTFVYCLSSFLLSRSVYNVSQLTSIIKIIVLPIVNSLVGIILYKIFKNPILRLEE